MPTAGNLVTVVQQGRNVLQIVTPSGVYAEFPEEGQPLDLNRVYEAYYTAELIYGQAILFIPDTKKPGKEGISCQR